MKTLQAFDLGIYNPYRMSNVALRVNQAFKEDKIFFKEDFFSEIDIRPWEIRYDNSYPTVFYDRAFGIYRCYYSTFTKDESSASAYLEDRRHKDYHPTINRVVSLCYAESKDGLNWEKPNLGITDFQGSKENNILGHYLHGSSVLLDEHEEDPNKRYKLFTKVDYGTGEHFMAVAFSADGIHFDNLIKCPDFNPRGDTQNTVVYDPNINKYVLMTRIWKDSMRQPLLAYSEDFIHWTPGDIALQSRDFAHQIYSMPFFIDGNYRIGLASIHHEFDELDEQFDKVDVELTYSRDYSMWHYVEAGQPFIANGKGQYPDGAFDSGAIFVSPPIHIDNKLYFYYIGGNGQHTNYREGSLLRASIDYGRYAYLEQKSAGYEAKVYTNGFRFNTPKLLIDADIEEDGYLTVELYTSDTHEKVQNVDIQTEKQGNIYQFTFDESLCHENYRLSIKFKNSRIYNFRGDFNVSRIEESNSLLRD